MKYKNIKYIFLLSIFLTTQVFSQQKEPQKTVDPRVVNPIKISQDYDVNQLTTLNVLLSKQDYIDFYDAFKKFDVPADAQIKFLSDKKYDGHTPLYWLMADYYAKTNHPLETHKWLYIATIMTQQDASLCTDATSKYASQKLLRAFPAAPDLTRITPQYISSAMSEVIFFIENLKTRTSPEWACNFGEKVLGPKANIVIPKQSWGAVRRKVLEEYSVGQNK